MVTSIDQRNDGLDHRFDCRNISSLIVIITWKKQQLVANPPDEFLHDITCRRGNVGKPGIIALY